MVSCRYQLQQVVKVLALAVQTAVVLVPLKLSNTDTVYGMKRNNPIV